jgi:hypothetical protein
MSRVQRSGGEGHVVGDVGVGQHLGWFHRRNHANNLLRLADLTSEDLWRLRRLTLEFRADPGRHDKILAEETVLCWFTGRSPEIAKTASTAVELRVETSYLSTPGNSTRAGSGLSRTREDPVLARAGCRDRRLR